MRFVCGTFSSAKAGLRAYRPGKCNRVIVRVIGAAVKDRSLNCSRMNCVISKAIDINNVHSVPKMFER